MRKRKDLGRDSHDIFKIRIFGTPRRISAEVIRSVGVGVACISLFLVPFIYISGEELSTILIKYLLILLCGVVLVTSFLISTFLSKEGSFVQSRIISFVLLLFLGYLLSAIFSVNPLISIAGSRGTWIFSVIGMLAFCFIIISTANLFTTPRVVTRFLNAAAISGFLLSIIYLSTVLLSGSGGTLEQPSFFLFPTSSSISIYLFITATLTLPLLTPKLSSGPTRLMFTGLTLIQLASAIHAGTYAISAMSLLIFSFSASKILSIRPSLRRSLPAFLLIAAIVFVVLSFPHWRPSETAQNQDTTYFHDLPFTISRWKTGVETWTTNLLTGTGPSMLHAEAPKHLERWTLELDSWDQPIYQIPNIFIHFLATTGIAGTIPLGILFFYLLRTYFVISDENTPEIAGVLGATSLWILVHMFSEMSTPVFLLGAFSIGISAALLPHTFHQPRGPRDAYILPVITTIALSTVLILSIIHTIQAENYYLDSMNNLSENPIAEATKATELQPYDPEYHRQRATLLTSYLLDHPDTINSQETIRQIQREYQLALSLDPFDTQNYLTSAHILQNIGTVYPDNTYDLTEISWISTAIEHAPRNPELYVQRGLIFSRTHRISAALRDFETAISLKNNYWISYIYAADAAFSSNQGTTARSLLTTVIDTNDDPVYTSIAKDMLNSQTSE